MCCIFFSFSLIFFNILILSWIFHIVRMLWKDIICCNSIDSINVYDDKTTKLLRNNYISLCNAFLLLLIRWLYLFCFISGPASCSSSSSSCCSSLPLKKSGRAAFKKKSTPNVKMSKQFSHRHNVYILKSSHAQHMAYLLLIYLSLSMTFFVKTILKIHNIYTYILNTHNLYYSSSSALNTCEVLVRY